MPEQEQPKLERLGKYADLEDIGRGGMARVFRAKDSETGQTVALKALLPELAAQPGFVKRFKREIETLRALDHPGIVKILDVGEEGHYYYYVMEYMDGATIEKQLRLRGKLAVPEALGVTRAVANALAYAHSRGVIHRDIKPANIMTNATGTVKLADFGIAKEIDATRLTVTGGIVGTADYMSPEQAEGRRVTRKSDVYSLGVCLYQMLTGRLPFVGKTYLDVIRAHRFSIPESAKMLNPAIPARIVHLIESMMEKDPEKRLPSAADVIAQLDAADQTKGELTEEERESARDMVRWALFPAADWRMLALKIAGAAAFVVISFLAAQGIWYRYFTTAEYKYALGAREWDRGNYAKAKDYFEDVCYHHPDSGLATSAGTMMTQIYYITHGSEASEKPGIKKPPDAEPMYAHALKLIGQGKAPQALKILRQIARDYPDSKVGKDAQAKLKELGAAAGPVGGKPRAPGASATPSTASHVGSSQSRAALP